MVPKLILPTTTGGWFAYAVALAALAFAYLRDRRKNDIDESAKVLGAWQKLVATHKQDIDDLKAEFLAYKKTALDEIAALRERLIEAERRIRDLEDENAGLKRQIIQNGQSTVIAISKSKKRGDKQDERLDDLTGRMDQGEGK